MEAELVTLLLLHTIGVSVFGRFEAETAWWRLTLKWIIILVLTYWLYTTFGHAAAFSLIVFAGIGGLTFHFIWCKRNGIHPLKATPRKRYYELRKWEWSE